MNDFILITYLNSSPLDAKRESNNFIQRINKVDMDDNNDSQKLAVFKDKAVRRIFYKDKWWFSIIDVCAILTDSTNSRRYWSDLKKQLIEKEGFIELYEKIVQLKMQAPDGKMRETDCANTESIFRIIQYL